MGSTYEALDAEIEMLITTWPDAAAVTTRRAGPSREMSPRAAPCRALEGGLVTRVYDLEGREALFLCVGQDNVEVYGPVLGEGLSVVESTPFGSPTTDWANLQAYGLWRDLSGLPAGVAPRLLLSGTVLRPASLIDEGGEVSYVGELLAGVENVEAVFGEVIASTMAVRALAVRGATTLDGAEPPGNVAGPTYATFSTVVVDRRTGEWVGGTFWFGNERIFSWNFGELTSGWISDERVPGGIPFTPNLAWSNVQSYAFWKMHGELQLAAAIAPEKNTEGCDGLHWLDNTILRPCCDDHDRCYEHYGCTWHSWWFQGSWACVRCNLTAIWCFVTAGQGGHSCEICCGDACPAECSWCKPAHGCAV